MLLVLLLGIADFGRVFHAGITVKAAARNGAEVAAQEYLQAMRNGAPIDYEKLHESAARVACQEAQRLPNTTFASDSLGGRCASIPVIRVCVHDDVDTRCGAPISGFSGTVPPECDGMQGDNLPSSSADPTWSPYRAGGSEASMYVEVRVCYQFTTLFNLQMSLPMNTGLNLGEIYLGDRSIFTVADY